jgi:hypothetical protein
LHHSNRIVSHIKGKETYWGLGGVDAVTLEPIGIPPAPQSGSNSGSDSKRHAREWTSFLNQMEQFEGGPVVVDRRYLQKPWIA